MEIIYLGFLYGLIILTVHYDASANPSKGVKLTILPQNDKPVKVHLKEVNSFLANEYLPIWTVENVFLKKLDSKQIMADVGPFTMYQDPETASAAVYYHKRNKFDGTIDVRYILHGFSISNNINQMQNIYKQKITNKGLFERIDWGHSDRIICNKPKIFPRQFSKWTGEKLPNVNRFGVRAPQRHPDNFYIETLIVVNYDLAQELLGADGNKYARLVSYFLTLFNSVDMLLSKLDSIKIKLNIAGIIIIPEQKSYSFLSKCYKEISYNNINIVTNVDAECASDIITAYLHHEQEDIPMDSFDIIMIITKYGLYEYIEDGIPEKNKMKYLHLTGLTSYPAAGIYKSKKLRKNVHSTIIMTDGGQFKNFPCAAHELVHSFGVIDHDTPRRRINEICREKIMKEWDRFCSNCLDWSDKTNNLVRNVFKTRDVCIFKNKPRSLYPPGSQIMLTANEQCQCYGYQSENKLRKQHWILMFYNVFGYCNINLQCSTECGRIDSTVVPMDGTPCNEYNNSPEKVCWNGKCIKIKNF